MCIYDTVYIAFSSDQSADLLQNDFPRSHQTVDNGAQRPCRFKSMTFQRCPILSYPIL